jgi:membrane-associated phospholipid phosphatase
VWSTFGQWFSALGAGSPGQSFPSAHTATAVGFAAALTWLYPQGRLLFPLLAVLVGCQRIACGAHYLSDVLVGAAAGCLVAQFILAVGRLPVWFARWEDRWRPK